jgi:hypothetical protein
MRLTHVRAQVPITATLYAATALNHAWLRLQVCEHQEMEVLHTWQG